MDNIYIYIYIRYIDHLVGLNQTWKYGRIYTSSITKNLLINKYPQLKGDVVHTISYILHIDCTGNEHRALGISR